MEDVLSDVELENMSNVDVSPDGSRLLIVCRSEENYEDTTVWLYDIAAKALSDITAVSYTHLDVYKRQLCSLYRVFSCGSSQKCPFAI